MAKQKTRRPTTRELDKHIKNIVTEVFTLQRLIQEIIKPALENLSLRIDSNSILIEKFIEYKKDTEEFVNFLDKESKNEEVKNKSPEKGKKEQTKGSGIAKASSKDGKRIGIGSLQQR